MYLLLRRQSTESSLNRLSGFRRAKTTRGHFLADKYQRRTTTRYWPPPDSMLVVMSSVGSSRLSRSVIQAAASSASAWVGHRPKISRPPLATRRSTVGMMGAGSAMKRSSGHRTTGVTLPLPVLQARWARRSGCGALFDFERALALRSVTRLSMLGPRSSLTERSRSTGSSHNQQRQPSASPTSSIRPMPAP